MRSIDLFAGVGGLSEGARLAGVHTVWAGNHWPLACEYFEANHRITPACQDLQQADWTQVPAHDVLLAAPACQGHSKARGKERPHHDALRATAWAVVSAAECHKPALVVVENVPDFADWLLYPAWCQAMHTLGYALAPMLIDAADHGVPQHRQRLFIVGTRSRHPLQLVLPRRPHVPASSVIDFEAGNWTRVDRPGRAPKTLARIAAGRRVFGDRFLAPYYGNGSGNTGRSIHRPIGTMTTKARWAVVDGNRMRMVSVPEARAFMGMRASYRLPEAATHANKLLGNGVCPPVAEDLVRAALARL